MISEKIKAKTKFTLLSILSRIKLGDTPVEIYKSWGWSNRRFTFHLKKLLKSNLIRLKARTSMNIYELTEQGVNFYIECIQQKPFSLEAHNISWIYDLKQEGSFKPEFISQKGIKQIKFHNVTVMWSSEHIWFDVVKLFGTNPYELENESIKLVEKVAEQLKSTGFIFENRKLMRKSHYGIIDPIITQTAKTIELSTPDYLVNSSEGYGELEYLTPEGADNYLKAIEGIAKLMPEIVKQQYEFSQNLKLHLSVLTKMNETLDKIQEVLSK
jgi:predicted transcriptional regulator